MHEPLLDSFPNTPYGPGCPTWSDPWALPAVTPKPSKAESTQLQVRGRLGQLATFLTAGGQPGRIFPETEIKKIPLVGNYKIDT